MSYTSFTNWPLEGVIGNLDGSNTSDTVDVNNSDRTTTGELLVSDSNGSGNYYPPQQDQMIQPLDLNQGYGYSDHTTIQPIDEKTVEQMVERVLIERMKADKDKGPEDLIFLMKTCGFQKEMIDIVRKALRRDWQVTKEPQERLETLIYGE